MDTENKELLYYNQLKKYFINLDVRVDRFQNTINQVGDDFIRVSAYNGKKLHFRDIDKIFDMKNCVKHLGVTQTRAQACATASHFKAYKQVLEDDSIQDNDYVLICEDDNIYPLYFKEKLNQILAFLNQSKFENANIVILKYMLLDRIVDYYDVFKYINKKHKKITENDIKEVELKDPTLATKFKWMISDAAFNDYYRVMKTDYGLLEWSFKYNLNPDCFNSPYYDNTQRLFGVYYIFPFGGACYLIRKKAIRKLLKKYKKPWWYADDLKVIAPPQDILFASPFLVYESHTGKISSIESEGDLNGRNEFVKNNFYYNKVDTKYYNYIFKVLKKCPFIQKYHYSSNKCKRVISKIIQNLLFIRY